MAQASRALRIKKIDLAASDSAGGLFSFNPGRAAIIHRVIIQITTAPSGACTADIGVATNATTLSDTLIDGADIRNSGTAAVFDNIENKGSNGKSRQTCSATQYVTGSVASGASAGLVGAAYVFWSVQ